MEQLLGGGINFLGVFLQLLLANFEKLGKEGFWWGIVQPVVEIFPSFR